MRVIKTDLIGTTVLISAAFTNLVWSTCCTKKVELFVLN